ncbi:radical SAM protein [Pseudaminobacter sp. NGMCC 1.201702]|uniref:radical SAM protein n=1 Tax=Pseudaminobacter sp. NGMCC 1.201702 TaxID=3391825 RepID=UPI0039EF0F88
MRSKFQPNPPLDFAWLEITNRCNLQCSHCYAESSPYSGEKDLLTVQQYLGLLQDLHRLGCTKVQFIGGEPTLNRDLPRLITEARRLGFEFVEVFTNLVALDESLLRHFVENQVAVATSFYSAREEIHDAVTTRKGSFRRTVANIRRVLSAKLSFRAGIILMDMNRDHADETKAFLEALGVENIGFDHVRQFGRATGETACGMDELCGSCAGGTISIGPDGIVAPCNMSKQWAVGSVLERPLEAILSSQQLTDIRHRIHDAVIAPARSAEELKMTCVPKTCGPYDACCPTTQACGPCAPNGCSPCAPKG